MNSYNEASSHLSDTDHCSDVGSTPINVILGLLFNSMIPILLQLSYLGSWSEISTLYGCVTLFALPHNAFHSDAIEASKLSLISPQYCVRCRPREAPYCSCSNRISDEEPNVVMAV